MNEIIRLAIRDAQQERRQTIPHHGGTPVSAERVAATHEAAQARRRARHEENKHARWEAAQQEAGYCQAANCHSPRWWYARRTRCLHCFTDVGECCQFHDDRSRTWYLVCQSCQATKGLDAPVERAIDPDTPKPTSCAYHPSVPKPPEVQCKQCHRWLCLACTKRDWIPYECQSCPEALINSSHDLIFLRLRVGGWWMVVRVAR